MRQARRRAGGRQAGRARTNTSRVRSTLVARIVALLGGPALLISGVPGLPAARAATITVNATVDAIADDGRCSLREAVIAANRDRASGGSAGECPAGNGADTIVLPAGRYTLALAGANEGQAASGDLDVLGDLTLRGADAATTIIDAAGLDRVLDVAAGAIVLVEGVTVAGGRLPAAAAGGVGAGGGGVRNDGVLVLRDCAVTDNRAGNGGWGNDVVGTDGGGGQDGGDAVGAPGGRGGEGGGILNSGTLTVERCSITANQAGGGGTGGDAYGGLGGDGVAPGGAGGNGGDAAGGPGGRGGNGGGILSTGALTLIDSTVAGNRAGAGGDGGVGFGGGGSRGADDPNGAGGSGGHGGEGLGGQGGAGGDGGGVWSSAATSIVGSTISADLAGDGGQGGGGVGGTGARGGNGGTDGGDGGDAGHALGGTGGAGGRGGGLAGGDMSVANSTIHANVAGAGGAGGGAVGSGPGGNGGNGGTGFGGYGGDGTDAGGGGGGAAGGAAALQRTGGTIVLVHVTVSANTARGGGVGGVGEPGGAGAGGTGASGNGIPGQTGAGAPGNDGAGAGPAIAGAPGITLTNTIVASNAPSNCGTGVTDGGHDISFPEPSCPGSGGNPNLGPLQNNGGPTRTQALGPGSAALDQVPESGAACTRTDQRGVRRPQGPACYIGAFEVSLGGIEHGRSVTLRVERRARGKVAVEDGFVACAQGVPVRVQRRDHGRWTLVGTARTSDAGRFVVRGTRRPGRYRALAKRVVLPSGDVCLGAVSPVVSL